jgi:hypothetical protein
LFSFHITIHASITWHRQQIEARYVTSCRHYLRRKATLPSVGVNTHQRLLLRTLSLIFSRQSFPPIP